MGKLVFRANVMRLTHQFIPAKQKEVPKVKKKTSTILNTRQPDGSGVPLPPRMVFNRDGSACYAHLEEEPPTETKQVKGEDGVEYFIAPKINWRKET